LLLSLVVLSLGGMATLASMLGRENKDGASVERACYIQSRNHLNFYNSSEPALTQSLARIVILQRGGGYKLEVLLQHYLQVLAFDDIVVIDNMSEDSRTIDILNSYSKQGLHLWKCDADYRYTQGLLVTHVMRWAAPFSDFVFPVDVDELLGVRVVNNDPASTTKNKYRPISVKQPPEPSFLVWNRKAFADALGLINTTAGKMLKMDYAMPLPPSCKYDPDDDPYTKASVTPQRLSSNDDNTISAAYHQDFCALKYANLADMGCWSKSFAMGKDFYETNDGNHVIGTHQHMIHQNEFAPCLENKEAACQHSHSLVLVHVTGINFMDWFIRSLQGAARDGHSARGYPAGCKDGMRGGHNCIQWENFNRVGFNPMQLEEDFMSQCPQDRKSRNPNKTISIQSWIQATCN